MSAEDSLFIKDKALKKYLEEHGGPDNIVRRRPYMHATVINDTREAVLFYVPPEGAAKARIEAVFEQHNYYDKTTGEYLGTTHPLFLTPDQARDVTEQLREADRRQQRNTPGPSKKRKR